MKLKIKIDDPQIRATWDATLRAKEQVGRWPVSKRGELGYECVSVDGPDGRSWSFVVKLWYQNVVTIALDSIDGSLDRVPFSFEARWDPAGRKVYSCAGLDWAIDPDSAAMRDALGGTFGSALARWSTAVRDIEQRAALSP